MNCLIKFYILAACVICVCSDVRVPLGQLVSVELSQRITNVTVINIPSQTSHLVYQVHSSSQLVAISNATSYYGTLEGKNVGFVDLINDEQDNRTFYIFTDNSTQFSVWIVANRYTPSDPIPGACQYKPYKLDPNLNTLNVSDEKYSQWFYQLEINPANVWNKWPFLQGDCNSTKILQKTSYHLYALPIALCGASVDGTAILNSLKPIPDVLPIDVLSRMFSFTNVAGIMQQGTLLKSITRLKPADPYPTFTFMKRHGGAYMFAIVVEFWPDIYSTPVYATYVPTIVNSCASDAPNTTCNVPMPDVVYLLTFTVLIGLIIMFVGGQFPRLFGGISWIFLVSLIALTVAQKLDSVGVFGIYSIFAVGLVIPLGLILTSVCFCKCFKNSARLVMFPEAILFSTIIVAALFYTPINTLSIWSEFWVFSFCVGILTICVTALFIYNYNMTLAITSVGIGSFCVLTSLSIVLKGSLFHNVLLDQFLRFADSTTLSAINYSPKGLVDVLIPVVWIVTTLFGGVIVYLVNRRRASRRASYDVLVDEDDGRSMRSAVDWMDYNTRSDTNQRSNAPLFDRNDRTPPHASGSTISYGTVDSTGNQLSTSEPQPPIVNYHPRPMDPPPAYNYVAAVRVATSNQQ